MKKFLKPYRHLIALLAIVMLAVALVNLGAPVALGLFIVGCWQLSQFAMSRRSLHGHVFTAGLTSEQIEEIENGIGELKKLGEYVPQLKEFFGPEGKIHLLEKLQTTVNQLRKSGLNGSQTGVRWQGDIPYVTDDCAKALTSVFVLDCSRMKNGLESMIPDENRRKHLVQAAAANLGIQQRAGGALSTSDIPLPTIYMPQIVELVFAYGAARKYATVFPLGSGLVKLPRLKAGEDDFGYLGIGTGGIGQNVPQKEVEAELVTFTANKGGGIIRIPYEIEEDTFIPIGQFLARYIARQFAKMEDKTIFIADGTPTYANQSGVATYCSENTDYQLQLATGNTKPSDATLDDFRTLRSKVGIASSYARTAPEMQARIEDVLKRSKLMLVVDEAHFVFNQSRRMYSRPELVDWIDTAICNCGVPIALVTTPQFIVCMTRAADQVEWNYRQFRRRVKRWEKLPSANTEHDIAAVARSVFKKADAEMISKIVGYALLSKRDLSAIGDVADEVRVMLGSSDLSMAKPEHIRRAIYDFLMPSDEAFKEGMDAARKIGQKKPRSKVFSAPLHPELKAPAIALPVDKIHRRGVRPVVQCEDEVNEPAHV